jgi:hypothetical protein
MNVCENCIHYEVCNYHITEETPLTVDECSRGFKNKADFVEVVRCKDCKYLYCFSAIDRQFYCKHFPKGLQGINIVEENPYCSYGERK